MIQHAKRNYHSFDMGPASNHLIHLIKIIYVQVSIVFSIHGGPASTTLLSGNLIHHSEVLEALKDGVSSLFNSNTQLV